MNIQIQWIGLKTIVKKEISRIFRIWTQTLLPSVITMSLYFLIFGNFIGSRIGDFDGIPYIQFIVPGLIMMAIINNAYSNVVSSFFGAKFQRNIEEMLVSPLRTNTIILGYIIGGMTRGLIVGFFVLLVAMTFTPLQFSHPTFIILPVILTSSLFSLGGIINSIFAERFDDISIIPTFILTPLTYLGGVFYSIHLLPPFWQKASLLNPILYLVNLFRYGFIGITDIPVTIALSALIGFNVILWVICNQLINRGIGLKS